jgi:DNA-directed RNA polymerase specialized sigma24 family protein
MDEPPQDLDRTNEADLADVNAFCLAYLPTIRRAVRLLGVPEGDVDDVAQDFVVKALSKGFLESYREFRESRAKLGEVTRFRNYLYRSLGNHVNDSFRRRATRARFEGPIPDEIEARSEPALDTDALYALDVLHQAVQALRRHCERTGKAHCWVIFEETLLADAFLGRQGKTRAELLELFPGSNPQFLDNSLTTAKRAFRRFVQEVIPRGLRDGTTAKERFDEWMGILRRSNAAQFNRLHLAYRVTPFLGPEMSQAASAALVIDDRAVAYDEPSLVPDDDELSILLSFRLELPLTEMLDPAELTQYVPPTSPFWLLSRAGARANVSPAAPRPERELSLLTLVDPTTAEAEALAKVDVVGLLARLKGLSKQLRRRTDHALPEVFSQLLYTLCNVLARVRRGADLHTIGPEALAGNVRWFLKQTWLDDRVRPLFAAGLADLNRVPAGGPPTEKAPGVSPSPSRGSP